MVPARLLDLTRLMSRLSKGPMTGVDRVEFAYLEQFLRLDTPCLGLVRTAPGFLLLDRPAMTALRDGTLGMAALDVFADEPRVLPALREVHNAVLTPHVGSLTVETRHAMGQLVVDNLLAHFAGNQLLTPVN